MCLFPTIDDHLVDEVKLALLVVRYIDLTHVDFFPLETSGHKIFLSLTHLRLRTYVPW